MTAERSNQFAAPWNPAISQLGCNFFDIELDPAMLDLPAAWTLGENRIAGSCIAVHGEPGRRHVDEYSSAPYPHVRKM